MRLLVLSLLVALAGCSARRMPVFTDSFRLTRIHGQPALLAPSISEAHPPAEPVQLAIGEPRGVRKGCTENGRLFHFAAARNRGWTARVPAPATQEDPETVQQELDGLLTRIDALEARGCLPRGESAIAGSLIEDSLAVKPNQALFYRLHYRPEGIMDLLPGVSLKVERAWFRPGAGGRQVHDLKHYIGISTHHYDLVRDAGGRLGLHLAASEQSGPLPSDRKLPDRRLGSILKPMPFARLFLLGQLVARRLDRVAMIVEAPSRETLFAATQMIRKRPDIGCSRELLAHGVSCVTFEGSVVISPEIRVFRKGAAIHTAAGLQLGNLPGLPPDALASLRVERLFHGSYYPVRFAPGDRAILTLTLASGDRIDW